MAISNSYVKLPEGKFDHDLTDLAYDFFEPSSGIILEGIISGLFSCTSRGAPVYDSVQLVQITSITFGFMIQL